MFVHYVTKGPCPGGEASGKDIPSRKRSKERPGTRRKDEKARRRDSPPGRALPCVFVVFRRRCPLLSRRSFLLRRLRVVSASPLRPSFFCDARKELPPRLAPETESVRRASLGTFISPHARIQRTLCAFFRRKRRSALPRHREVRGRAARAPEVPFPPRSAPSAVSSMRKKAMRSRRAAPRRESSSAP